MKARPPQRRRPFSPSTPSSKISKNLLSKIPKSDLPSPLLRIPTLPSSKTHHPTLLNSKYIPTTAKTRSKHRKIKKSYLRLQEHQQSQTPKPSVLINRSSNQTTINDPRINKHERLRYLLRFRIKNAEELRLIHYTSSFKTYEIRTL